MPSHTVISSGVLALVSDRSAPSASTVNVVVPLLLFVPLPGLFGSGVAEVMVAVLVTSPLLLGPVDGTVATMVIVATSPTGMSPVRLQVRTLLAASLLQVHAAGAVPPVMTKPAGSASVTVSYTHLDVYKRQM